jgi:excisionase family DNA binding protein
MARHTRNKTEDYIFPDGQVMPERLLTTEQVAQYLNVDKFTVYRLLTQKNLPAFKVGNQWRFKRNLIEAWLKRHATAQVKRAH